MRKILFLLVAVLLTGCKVTERVEYVPVETIKTEYKDRLVETYDSIHVHDSVFVAVRGDTVYKYKQQIVYKDKTVHDTAYIQRRDSVPVPYPVERQLGKWEQFKVDFGGYLLVAALALIGYVVFRIIIWARSRLRD